MDEYYGWMFENSVPGLPEAAAQEAADAARLHAQVRRVQGEGPRLQAIRNAARPAALAGASIDPTTRSS